MSQRNVEIVRRIYDEWSRGAFDNREAFAEDLDFEMAGWAVLQSGSVKARGIDGMASVWREVMQGWDHFRTSPIEDLIETGDQIVVISRVGGRGRISGVEVYSQRGAVFTFRDGKIVRLFLTDRDEALEAVGRRD